MTSALVFAFFSDYRSVFHCSLRSLPPPKWPILCRVGR